MQHFWNLFFISRFCKNKKETSLGCESGKSRKNFFSQRWPAVLHRKPPVLQPGGHDHWHRWMIQQSGSDHPALSSVWTPVHLQYSVLLAKPQLHELVALLHPSGTLLLLSPVPKDKQKMTLDDSNSMLAIQVFSHCPDKDLTDLQSNITKP